MFEFETNNSELLETNVWSFYSIDFLYRMKWMLSILVVVTLIRCGYDVQNSNIQTPFETSEGRQTATYEEGIAWWRSLEEASPFVSLQTFGMTDAGLPLHVVIVNPRKNFSKEKICSSDQIIVMINNAIHPGEPDGVDASMLFVRDLVTDPNYSEYYDNTVLLIIPFYNVGGALNRNCCSRSNQNGPESYGFRGNARNLDLNRDFIKCDSKNARSFAEFFTTWDPDVYLETHVSNGADYPYTMTYLSTQPDKLGGEQGEYLSDYLGRRLYASMKSRGFEMTPYVHFESNSPDSGIACFYDSPRYSTGYAALRQSIGLLTETHMLKPFDDRVQSTRQFMHALINNVRNDTVDIRQYREDARTSLASQTEFPIDWEVDRVNVGTLSFKGYTAYTDTSRVTGHEQLYYDQSKPWEADIPYFNRMKATKTVTAPKYYLVPTAWHEVVQRLELNGVEMKLIESDSTMDLTAYEIVGYETSKTPFEGHYFHYNTRVKKHDWPKLIQANMYYKVDVNQPAKRFIVEVLEPEGPDSYFNWNFFDEILQQKEWYSSYVFDKEAETMLEDPAIKVQFDEKIHSDSNFASNPRAQLYFLYTLSDHFEGDRFKIYPVYRID